MRQATDLISIPGTNANRLVTFQSQTNDTAEIRFNSIDQYLHYTIRFKGADDIRFRNLKLRATGAIYSIVLDYYRGANNTIVENCALTGMSGSGAVASKNIIFSEDSYYENRVMRNNILNEGTYGICKVTGEPIPVERLEEVPVAKYSVQGKEILEKQKMRGM